MPQTINAPPSESSGATDQHLPVRRYVGLYVACYLGILTAAFLLASATNWPMGLWYVAAFGAVSIAIPPIFFARRNARLMSRIELMFYSLACGCIHALIGASSDIVALFARPEIFTGRYAAAALVGPPIVFGLACLYSRFVTPVIASRLALSREVGP